jgi:hypothetical protein
VLPYNRIDRIFDAARVAHIELNRSLMSPRLAAAYFRRLLRSGKHHIRRHNSALLGGQGDGNGAAQTPSRPGDKGDFSRDTQIHVAPPPDQRHCTPISPHRSRLGALRRAPEDDGDAIDSAWLP